MNRLLVATAALQTATPQLPKEALNHMKVWRLKDGEEVELFDGRGTTRLYRYCAADKQLVASRESHYFPAPQQELVLIACVTKGSRWDWTIEKATELGVARIIPVISQRTIVRIAPAERAAKRMRWQRVAEDAARQSCAVWLPQIEEPCTFDEILPRLAAFNCFVGALTDAVPVEPLLTAAQKKLREEGASARPIALFVGPEGDFTPEELESLLRCAIPTSFGATILRAETAALYGLTVLAAVVYADA